MNVAYLLTGGNLGERKENLQRAKQAIAQQAGQVTAASALYETEAWGIQDQAPFLNQALEIRTELSADDLLQVLLSIEQDLGRVREVKYGPRIIDIDIIFYNHAIIRHPGLTVPHPHMQQRRFVLECLADIAPDFQHPVLGKTVRELLKECPDTLTVNKLR